MIRLLSIATTKAAGYINTIRSTILNMNLSLSLLIILPGAIASCHLNMPVHACLPSHVASIFRCKCSLHRGPQKGASLSLSVASSKSTDFNVVSTVGFSADNVM